MSEKSFLTYGSKKGQIRFEGISATERYCRRRGGDVASNSTRRSTSERKESALASVEVDVFFAKEMGQLSDLECNHIALIFRFQLLI